VYSSHVIIVVHPTNTFIHKKSKKALLPPRHRRLSFVTASFVTWQTYHCNGDFKRLLLICIDTFRWLWIGDEKDSTQRRMGFDKEGNLMLDDNSNFELMSIVFFFYYNENQLKHVRLHLGAIDDTFFTVQYGNHRITKINKILALALVLLLHLSSFR